MATLKYLADIDLNKNALNNAVIQPLSTAPDSPADGQIYFDTDTADLNVYNGSAWVRLGPTGAGDIESVVAGTGLTGGGTSGDVTLNVIGGTGITANANDIALTNGLIADGSNITSVGTIGTGVWQGTTIKTAYIGDDQVTEDKLANTLLAEIDANTAKVTNVSTNLSIADSTGARTIASSDGTNAVIPIATTLVSGVMSTTIFDAVTTNTEKSTNATHSGEVTGSGALTIADNIVDEANLKVSNAPTNGQFLSAQSGNTGGLTWAAIGDVTGNAATVTTNANLTGHITSSGNAAVLGSFTVAQLSAAISNASISGNNTGDQTTVSGSSGTVTSIGNLTGDVTSVNRATTIAPAAVHHSMLHDDIISGQGELTGVIDDTDEFLVSDAGTVKRADFSVVRDAVFADISGDGTIAAGGALTVTQSAGDFTVTGDLIVSGDTVTVNTANLLVEDPLIGLASGNGANSVDIGIWGKYTATGAKYTGLFRDASDSDMWKLFATTGGTHASPGTGTTINTTSGFTYANLTLATLTGDVTGNLTGDVTGNADTATVLANARTIGGVSFNGGANINLPGVNAAGNQATSGLAGTATKLATARAINSVDFDGTGAITVTAAAGTLTGTTLKSTVVSSSLASVGTIETGVWNGTAIATAYIADDAVTEDKLANTLLAEIDANTAKITNSATNLTATTAASQITINSSDGNNVVIAEASGSIAGVMTVAHHDKLDGIEADATADQSKSDIDGLAITTVGTLDTGNATAIVDAASATAAGKVELATTAEALAGTDTTRAVTAAGLAARSYRAAIGDGSATAIAVTHSLGTRDVNVQMYDASSYETVYAQVVRNTTAQVTVTFNAAPTTNDVIILVNKID
jgi:hypothetical protein